MGRAVTGRRGTAADPLAAFIARVMADAPAPTPAQVQRLRDLLPPVTARPTTAAA